MKVVKMYQKSIEELFGDDNAEFIFEDLFSLGCNIKYSPEQLWIDLVTSIFPDGNTLTVDLDNEFYLGPITLFKNRKKQMVVIDGNSRLTRGLLLLAICYDKLADSTEERAKKLRAEGSRAVIIFCTNYAQYAINGYEVGALSYIIKPVEKNSFDNSMDRAVNMLKHRVEHKMLVRTVEGQELINISELMYVEVMVHNLFFHIRKGDESVVVRTRGSLNEVSDRLSNLSFARCSSCYLVNLAYVTCVGKKEVQLSDGHSLAISRKFVKEFTNKFMRYIAEFGVIDG